MTYFFVEKYIDFFLYDGSIDTIYSAAMALLVFGMVRWWSIVTKWVGMRNNIDHAVLFAGLTNCTFFGGIWYPFFLFGFLYTWNFWFKVLKPVPVEDIRVVRKRKHYLTDSQYKEFLQELKRYEVIYRDDMYEATGHALFSVLTGNNTTVSAATLLALFEHWGIMNAE